MDKMSIELSALEYYEDREKDHVIDICLSILIGAGLMAIAVLLVL